MKSILVSRCLLGDKVRYDGGHCLTHEILNLRENFNILPICPEVMAGMPTPREPIELKKNRVFNQLGEDLTHQFEAAFRAIDKLL